ncbi:MAG: 2-C-methyl-D-erythritol 2,4-cyclodiphosphate synthase [Acidimicrobiales bacterium]
MRVGFGFDVHAFDAAGSTRPLVLGGVVFPGEVPLVGHSDADAVAHAVADALLGAADLGDIGGLFADDDPRWKGADSIVLLADVARRVTDAGYRIGNVDCTVVAQKPRIAPRRDEMRARLSEAVGAPVSVKATTSEGLGAIGRVEGLACWAIAAITTEEIG